MSKIHEKINRYNVGCYEQRLKKVYIYYFSELNSSLCKIILKLP